MKRLSAAIIALSLLLTACGTEPGEPVLDFIFERDRLNARTGAYYYKITPTFDGVPVEWTEVLRPGWCPYVNWNSYLVLPDEDLNYIAHGGRRCVEPIENPESAIIETFIVSQETDDLANWIVVQAQVRGEGSHYPLRECWFFENDGFRECHESPIDDGPQGGTS